MTLAVPVVVDAYGHHHGHVLVGAAPRPLEVDAVDVDVGVGANERAVSPLLDRGERLLVQVRDGRRRHARPPQDLGDVLDPARRDAGQVHLDHRLLDAGLAAPVALDDRRGEPHPLELGHAQRDLAGRRCQAPVVVAGPIGLAPRGALVALRADEVARLLIQKAVQGVLDRLSHQLAQIGLQALLVQCYDWLGHGSPPICFLSRQLESYRGGPCPPSYLDAILLSKCAKKLYVTTVQTWANRDSRFA